MRTESNPKPNQLPKIIGCIILIFLIENFSTHMLLFYCSKNFPLVGTAQKPPVSSAI